MATPSNPINKLSEYENFSDFYNKRLKTEPDVVQFDIADDVLTVDCISY